MNTRSRFDAALLVLAALVLAMFLPKMFLAESALYTEVLTLRVLLVVGCGLKIVMLWASFVFAARVARSYARGEAMRMGWLLTAAWLGAWAVAQSVLGFYQIGQGRSAPFPSLGDAFFMLGYPAMIAAFVVFVRALAATGLVGALRGQLMFAIGAAVPALVLLVVVLRPVLAAEGAGIEKALNVAYPSLDVLALIPALVLARFGARLAGGALFFVWSLLSVGIVFMVAGDLLYAWFTALSFSALDPLLDVAYVLAYGLVARALYQQHRVSVAVPGGGA
jgi:hypothetical protein